MSTRTQPAAPPSVILVGVDVGGDPFDPSLEELGLLAQTAGYTVADRVTCKRRAPDPALFVGSGKAEEIQLLAQSTGASEILFDQSLSPAQQRNLERLLGMPVNDRTLLILEIFAQRARSHEGKLQVELARLHYLSTRLINGLFVLFGVVSLVFLIFDLKPGDPSRMLADQRSSPEALEAIRRDLGMGLPLTTLVGCRSAQRASRSAVKGSPSRSNACRNIATGRAKMSS